MNRNCSTPETSWSPIWRSRRRRCQPVGGPTRSAPPPRAPHHPSASYDAPPHKGARRPPGTGTRPGAAVAGHRPPVRRGSRTGHRYEPVRDRGTRGDEAGRRGRPRARAGLDRGSEVPCREAMRPGRYRPVSRVHTARDGPGSRLRGRPPRSPGLVDGARGAGAGPAVRASTEAAADVAGGSSTVASISQA